MVLIATMRTAGVRARGNAPKARAKEVGRSRLLVQWAAEMLKLISDPTRLRVILLLSEGERPVEALCEEVRQDRAVVSYHLSLLRCGGLVTSRRLGKSNACQLTEAGEELAKAARRVAGWSARARASEWPVLQSHIAPG
jgi:DNA-binding transcriptional ArsR family regulator